MPKCLMLSAAMLALVACSRPAPTASNAAPTNTAVPHMTATLIYPPPPPPGVAAAPTITVDVSLTNAASGLLSSLGQDVIVSADFYGAGNGKAKALQDEMGEISFGDEERVSIPAAGAATLKVPPFDPKLLPDIDGKPQLLINVFSGVGMNPGNKLDCGLFQDDVAKAQAQPIQISCKVIGEPGPGGLNN